MGDTEAAATDAQRRLWARGDYPAVARHLMPASDDLVDAAGIGAGSRVLDVGVGDGNATVAAARRGAAVTGVDISPDQLALARRRLAAEGVQAELRDGDAQALPVPDGAFDAVVSVLAMMFAPDHRQAAAELVRACRPGGTVGIVTWSEQGWFSSWRRRAAGLVPPGPARPEEGWSDPAEVRRRLEAAGLVDVTVDERPLAWEFPTVEAAADFFLEAAGGFIAFREAATDAGNGDQVRPRLLEALAEANVAGDGACRLRSPYLRAVARR